MDISGLNQTAYTDLILFVQGSLNLIIAISALLAVIMLVYAGFQYILSKGEGDKADKATKTIVYTLIGLIIVFVAPLVIRFILSTILNPS